MAGERACYKIAAVKKPLGRNTTRGLFNDGYLGFCLDFVSLHSFLALYGDECHLLPFFKAFKAVACNSAEVDEQIWTALWSDKTKTFLVVKPLNGTALTCRHFLISLKLKLVTASFT
jgi:hypothetical protein